MTLDEKNRFLKNLKPEDFLTLGDDHIAYVREMDFMGKKHFAIHAADGQPITIASTRDLALSMADETELELVTLH